MKQKETEAQESEFLQYTGNKVPRVIRFAWTVLVLFIAAYCIRYVWPDLVQWIGKVRQ